MWVKVSNLPYLSAPNVHLCTHIVCCQNNNNNLCPPWHLWCSSLCFWTPSPFCTILPNNLYHDIPQTRMSHFNLNFYEYFHHVCKDGCYQNLNLQVKCVLPPSNWIKSSQSCTLCKGNKQNTKHLFIPWISWMSQMVNGKASRLHLLKQYCAIIQLPHSLCNLNFVKFI